MTPAPKYSSIDERVAVLESEVSALLAQQRELAQLLREHMEREEVTTSRVIQGITGIQQRMSRWHGMALGGTIVVSAVWAVILAAIMVLKH